MATGWLAPVNGPSSAEAVIRGWSRPGLALRVAVLLATGVTWAIRSVQGALMNPDYYAPTTFSDYVAVYSYSAVLLLTAASLLVLREVTRPPLRRSWGIPAVAAAFAVTGITNGLEDGFGIRSFGTLYVVGALASAGGLLAIAWAFWRGPAGRPTFVPAVGALALMGVSTLFGAVGLVAWAGLAVVVLRERRAPLPAGADA